MRRPIGRWSLNVSKTKELIVYYRERRAEHAPIDVAVVKRVENFKFLDVHITIIIMVQTHKERCEGGMTTPFPPQETENISYGVPRYF
jgi:hypothetical protein